MSASTTKCIDAVADAPHSRGQTKFAAADLRQRRNSLVDFLMAQVGETQPQTAFGVGLVHRPLGPRVDGDARGLRQRKKFQRIHAVGQLDPQENAALRIVELGGRAEMLTQ